MNNVLTTIFDFLAVAFDKIPVLNKFKGYRAILGFVGLGITEFLAIKGYVSGDLRSGLTIGFTGLTALALNAKGREWKN